MTISLRLAGFEVRDVIEWLYFSGFPKSHNVSKAFDRRAGAEREILGVNPNNRDRSKHVYNSVGNVGSNATITAPATNLARKYDGWGTALKPAHEPIIVVRKPLIDADTGRKLTVADCVEKYGTGAINIDASRIATEDILQGSTVRNDIRGRAYASGHKADPGDLPKYLQSEQGRFPANCITLDEGEFYSKYFDVSSVANITPQELSKKASKKDRNSDWQGEEIALEPKDSGSLVASTRGQLKDLRIPNPEYERKVPKNANTHPTVKPTDLMAWLVRLVTPIGGTVLDPFAGSGSTLVAAKREGFGFIGVELTEEYIPIIKARAGVKADEEEAKE